MNKQKSRSIWIKVIIIFLSTAILIAYYKTAIAENTLYTNISVKVASGEEGISVSVKYAKSCELQFYMFNLDGQLVKQYLIKGNTMLKVATLAKGTYTYDVFHLDAKVKTGKIELK